MTAPHPHTHHHIFTLAVSSAGTRPDPTRRLFPQGWPRLVQLTAANQVPAYACWCGEVLGPNDLPPPHPFAPWI